MDVWTETALPTDPHRNKSLFFPEKKKTIHER